MNKRLNKFKFTRFLLILFFIVLIIVKIIISEKIVAEEYKKQELINNYKHLMVYRQKSTKEHTIEKKEIIPIYNIPLSKDIQEYIYNTCKEFDIEYEIALAVINLESSYDSNNISNNYKNGKIISKDRGLFQINSRYEAWYAELAGLNSYNIFDSKNNIRMGIAGLSYYKQYWINKGIKDKKTLQIKMLNSYNAGIYGYENIVKKSGKISRSYDRIIFQNKDRLEELIEED
jgi:soluble lytic murein transglycosylase-like protein